MTTPAPLTKFSDLIRNATTLDKIKILDDIKAAASSMSLADLKSLTSALAAEAKYQEAKTSKKAQRLARLQAATESDDPRYTDAQRIATSGLRRLGLGSLNAHCENGLAVADLDAKMKAANWGANERIMLKANLNQLGLLDA